jgi:predicted phosphohydrolase
MLNEMTSQISIQEISLENWYFPPTRSRSGKQRAESDVKEIIRCDSNLFERPVILASDLHSHGQAVFDRLSAELDLSRYVVLTVGDMAAAQPVFGSDGDPTDLYEFLAASAAEFYFVQGNHDLPPADATRLICMRNRANLPCYVQDGRFVASGIGRLGGVSGTISNKVHPHKKTSDEFYKVLRQLPSGLKVLMTHETPSVLDLVGQRELLDEVVKKRPLVHVYGHCHHPKPITFVHGIYFLNVDSRVLIFEPQL